LAIVILDVVVYTFWRNKMTLKELENMALQVHSPINVSTFPHYMVAQAILLLVDSINELKDAVIVNNDKDKGKE